MSSTKPIMHLRVYKSNGLGTQISLGEDGKIQNENHLIKEFHNTIEYKNFLKYIGIHGYIKVQVEKVVINGEDVKDLISYQQEVDFALKPEAKKELTADQKRIAELESKLDALLNGGAKKEDNKKGNDIDEKEKQAINKMLDNEKERLTKARAEYEKVFGKKGHHSWSVKEIESRIIDQQNKI